MGLLEEFSDPTALHNSGALGRCCCLPDFFLHPGRFGLMRGDVGCWEGCDQAGQPRVLQLQRIQMDPMLGPHFLERMSVRRQVGKERHCLGKP